MYTTQEEAQQKLRKTVVFYNKKPVYIRDIDSNLNVLFYELPFRETDEYKVVHINDSGFNFRNLGGKLGYINYAYQGVRDALYSMRVPVRKAQQTQGLSDFNVNIQRFNGDKELGLSASNIVFSHIIKEKFTADTLTSQFIDIKEIRDKFSKEDRKLKSLAFTKELAIRKPNIGPFYLMYKGKDIGWSEDLDRFKVAEDYRFLEETLVDMEGLKVA